jgi:CDP-6-deoxy-D-xylo-4-hexulose-3-dehydrase
VFVDVDSKTLAIDLIKAQELIDNSRIPIAGIFPIHPLGHAIPPSSLDSFTKKNELLLINDVCESLGSWSEGKHAGTSGVAASFSFYFSHHITTMEGGGVATDDSYLADDLRSMRSHGWSRDRSDVKDWNNQLSNNDSKFLFVSTGYNVRPLEIQAAIGAAQIKSISQFIERRKKIAKRVILALSKTNLKVIGEESFLTAEGEKSNSWMLIPIYVNGENAIERRKLIIEQLENKEIETRPVLTGNFLAQPAIQRITRYAIDSKNFRVAQDITDKAFLVGAHHDLSENQIDFLCKTLKEAASMGE